VSLRLADKDIVTMKCYLPKDKSIFCFVKSFITMVNFKVARLVCARKIFISLNQRKRILSNRNAIISEGMGCAFTPEGIDEKKPD
jgi:hypothetical protein